MSHLFYNHQERNIDFFMKSRFLHIFKIYFTNQQSKLEFYFIYQHKSSINYLKQSDFPQVNNMKQFLMEQKEIILMEKNLRISRKRASCPQQNCQNIDPITPSSQFFAKNILFQLAQNQRIPEDSHHQLNRLKINLLVKGEPKTSRKEIRNPYIKCFRKTVHVRAFGERSENQMFDVPDNSIFSHLKMQLRKLQSPQKQKEMEEKRRKIQYLQERVRRKNQLVLVEQLFDQKPVSTAARLTPKSNNKSVSTALGHFSEGRSKALKVVQPTPLFNDPNQKISIIKEARKNRTLKSLLF